MICSGAAATHVWNAGRKVSCRSRWLTTALKLCREKPSDPSKESTNIQSTDSPKPPSKGAGGRLGGRRDREGACRTCVEMLAARRSLDSVNTIACTLESADKSARIGAIQPRALAHRLLGAPPPSCNDETGSSRLGLQKTHSCKTANQAA